MMKKFVINIIIIAGILGFFSSCEEIPQKFETEDDLISISDYLYENDSTYSHFIRIMEESQMDGTLGSYNPNGSKYTLFLPSNEAIEGFIEENSNYSSLDELVSDKEFIWALTRYHVVNRSIITNNFPLGALPDSCMTGDYLIIAYIHDLDSTYYKVNNLALVEYKDIEMTNGVIHVIDHVLEPVTFTGYEWLENNEDYSIIAELLSITGLKDTLGGFKTGSGGKLYKNNYSLIVEADSIYQKDGINDINELLEKYNGGQTDYTNELNPIYQLAAYHIVDGSWFLADLYEGTNNYNTYASLPVQISTGVNIRMNTGVSNFDSIYSPTDSVYTYINYLEIKVNESNVQTKNGPIHFVDHIMELYRPKRTQRTFQFYEEPLISKVRNETRRFIFTDPDEFTVLTWAGTDEMVWEKTSNSSERASNKDYLEIEGDFEITYKIPKILQGQYGVQLYVNTDESDNATIQLFLDGKQLGSNLNLTTGGTSYGPYRKKNMGLIEFNKYTEHTVTVRSLIPGKFTWDWIRFESNINDYNDNTQ